MENMKPSQLHWDCGTAYDLFISLDVLHYPAEYGLRGVWAAGVRARLPAPHREMLEQSLLVFSCVPFSWLHSLPEPKDSHTALWVLSQIPPEERLPTLALEPAWPPEYAQVLRKVYARRRWSEEDREALNAIHREVSKHEGRKPPSQQELAMILDWWTRPEEFGERFLEALSEYQEVFFGEEEKRIRPALRTALAQAKERSTKLGLTDLLEELTQGVRFEILNSDAVVLAPSYWCTPLVYFGKISDDRTIYLFGARPADDALIPGEKVPDALLQVLKALSDSTRLQILQYLSKKPLTPTQLSQRLRLRVPTVVHHLKILRLAGLIRLTLGEAAVAKYYEARPDAVEKAFDSLNKFLKGE
jgi:DNA-binding transcriptional ArsR family regulator